MTSKKYLLFLCISLTMSLYSMAQANKTASDFLQVPGPVLFNNKAYSLTWSSHPSPIFYKQEYLAKGDDLNNFSSMLMLDAISGEAVKDAVSKKIAELKKMKESNPVINYEIINNAATGEYLLDFLLTANGADGSMRVAERNVYRYKKFTDKAGHQGVLLFGISNRVYGPEIKPYLNSLKSTKTDLVTKVAQMKIPEIQIN